MNIVRLSGIALSTVSIIALSGCQGMYRSTRFRAAAAGEIHVNEPPYRAVCDVDRTRARAELLKQYEVETFRAVAQKVSHEVSKDDILDLRRLEPSTGARADRDWEMLRRRGELIHEIYSGAIARAGISRAATVSVENQHVSYEVDVDDMTLSGGPYIGIVRGHLAVEKEEIGKISGVLIAASSDQSRYYVALLQPYRFGSRSDGSAEPLFEAVTLWDAVSDMLPSRCGGAGSNLDQTAFNTVEGI